MIQFIVRNEKMGNKTKWSIYIKVDNESIHILHESLSLQKSKDRLRELQNAIPFALVKFE